MFCNQIPRRGLLLLAVACSQPGVASGDGSRAAVSSQGEAASPPFAAARTPIAELVPSPASAEPALTEPASVPVTQGAQKAPTFARFHPRGAWRLANPAALEGVVLWVDQILIRHDATRNEVSFNLAYWSSVPPPPGRSREQALALAQQVATEARQTPNAFAELARQYSEDLPSREEGGALGGLSAAELSGWPQVLDALAETQPGQTSNVVETAYGFHVFRRRQPPPEQTRSGVHLVIGHDRAEWLALLARGPLPHRTRLEGLALATDLYRQARARPERFKELVEQYSEHRDAVLGGDFGSWSTREPNPFPPRMLRLGQLALGEVGAVIETHLGFEVILRTEPPARPQYAARIIRLPFDPAAPETADDSRARVLTRAEALARSYAAEPQRFGAAGELLPTPIQWQGGRGVPAVELQLEKLALGAVSPSPAQAEFSFQISERVAPEPIAPVDYATELPAPAYPDVPFHLAALPCERQRELLRESGRLAAADLHLSRVKRAQLQKLQEGAALAEPEDPSIAIPAVQRTLDELRTLLGPSVYEKYLSVLQRELAGVVLGFSADSPFERGI
jgi:hypothetical protein